jgi:hypothetical protein
MRERAREYQSRSEVRVARKAYQARYYAETRKKADNAETQLWSCYGIDFEDWARLYEKQKHRCAGCGRQLDFSFLTHVDHNHTTGKVRGLLCKGCNNAIGETRDNPRILRALADYLERSS